VIISASRYTDIPAFYTTWFMNRVRAGHCMAPNPSNEAQGPWISLAPRDVDVIVFWTRNARPMMRHLEELDKRGYLYYFQYTLLANPRRIDPRSPPVEEALETFRDLAARIGPQRVIWRYDPIVLSKNKRTDVQFHRQTFERIARALTGSTRRCVVSIVDDCPQAHERLRELAAEGYELVGHDGAAPPQLDELMPALVRLAGDCGMEIRSCSERIDLRPYGVAPGKCIDDEHIAEVFGIEVAATKDTFEDREVCGCVTSRDIGMPDTCLHGCQYCYASRCHEQNRVNFEHHDPDAPSLRSST
jgi:hypothetical protein